ncbi:MAG: PQQ-binding-like beta-propeller repeat protein [Verrucomicrobiota bacterium]
MSNIEQIWPEISAEIKRARRIRTAQRAAAGVFAGALLIASAFIAAHHSGHDNNPAEINSGWNLQRVAVSPAIAPSYPLAHGGKLFVLRREKTTDNIAVSDKLWHVACLDNRSGRVIWKSDFKVASARMAIGSGRLYVLYTRDRQKWQCAALSEKDGGLFWRRETQSSGWPGPSTLLLAEDKVCWTSDRTIICRNATAGTLKWTATINSASRLSPPSYNNGKVLTASGGSFHILSADNGKLERTASLSGNKTGNGRIRGGLTVRESGNRIYMGWNGSYGGYIQCRTSDMTKILWQKRMPSFLKMELADGSLVARSMDIRAYDLRTGALKWKAPVGGCGNLAFDNGRIYAVDAADRREIVALDNSTGNEMWRREIGSSCSGIVVSKQMGFVNNNEGILQALPLTHNRKRRNKG